jgi:hypothetical protein
MVVLKHHAARTKGELGAYVPEEGFLGMASDLRRDPCRGAVHKDASPVALTSD